MRFLRSDENNGINNQIVVEHRGERLAFNISTYRNIKITDNLILDINNFWSRLPVDVQDKIFQCYNQIWYDFKEIEHTRKLDQVLSERVAELFEYHPFKEIMVYIGLYSNLKWPTDLKTEYGTDHVKELTYLKNEYRELIGLAMAMKIMIPIWGEYIDFIHSEVSNNTKNYRAAGLLVKSSIVQSTGYQRLKQYIEAAWEGNTQPHSTAAVIGGLDESQVPSWLLGNTLVRRLANAELIQANSVEEPKMLVSLIFNYSDHLTSTMDKEFGGRVTDKSLDGSNLGDDDNTSVAENYKIKSDVSEGIVIAHQIYIKTKVESILRRLDPTVEVREYYRYRSLFDREYERFQITPFGKAVTQWVLHPVVTAKIIEYVDYDAVINMYVMAYTLLKHWGFDHVAMILLSQPDTSANNGGVAAYARKGITPDQMKALDEIYVDSPQDNRRRQKSRLHTNVAANAIALLTTEVYGMWWKVCSWEDPKMLLALHANVQERLVALPYDMDQELARLVIHLKTNIHPGLTSPNLNQQ